MQRSKEFREPSERARRIACALSDAAYVPIAIVEKRCVQREVELQMALAEAVMVPEIDLLEGDGS